MSEEVPLSSSSSVQQQEQQQEQQQLIQESQPSTLSSLPSQATLDRKYDKMVLRVYDESSSNQYKTVVATPDTTVGEIKCKYLVKLGVPTKNAALYSIWAFLEPPDGAQLDDTDSIFDCFDRLKAPPGSKIIIRCLKNDQIPQEMSKLTHSRPLTTSIETLCNTKSKIPPSFSSVSSQSNSNETQKDNIMNSNDSNDNSKNSSNSGNDMVIDVNFAGFISPMPPAAITVSMWATAGDVMKKILEKLGISLNDIGSYGFYTVVLENSLETLIPEQEMLLGIEFGDKFIFRKKV